MRRWTSLAFAAAVILGAPAAQAADLTLKGLDGRTRTLSEAQLKALPHRAASMDDHGTAVPYDGVSIDEILPMLGWGRDEPLRGAAFAKVLIFTASDGYVVALTLAQTDQEFGAGPVVIADGKGGEPLEGEGPFRLIVEGDKRPARSARNLTGIELRDVK
jgi:hypothetical protein